MIPRRTVLSAGLALTTMATVPQAAPSRSPWRLKLREDFTTPVPLGSFAPPSSAYPELLTYPDGTAVNGGGLYYPSRTVSVANRVLTIRMHTDTRLGRPLSAAVGVQGAQTYGRWDWKLRASSTGTGWGFVCLLWPQDDSSWPGSGEMDWPEGDITGPLGGFFHPRGGGDQAAVDGLGYRWSDWNTYSLQWQPDLLRFLVNGRTAYSTTSNVPDTPMRWVIQGGPANPPTRPNPAAVGTVQLAVLRTYTLA